MENDFSPAEFRRLNDADRMWFVEYWARYIKTHSDKDWSKQQNVIINSQIQSARSVKLTPRQYLEIKGEVCRR